jgi:biopolymer transport protein ExbB
MGKYTEGSFAIMGPMIYFVSADGKIAGFSERSASMEPRVVPIGDELSGQIGQFVKSGSGLVPVDTTLGKARAIATTRDTIAGHIAKGGVWMGPILFFAGLSLITGIFKAIEISGFKRLKTGLLASVFAALREGKSTEALAVLKKEPGPSSDMLQEAVRNLHLPKELVEEFMYESMLAVQPKLERGLSFISITAAVAPLLGLLGTVTGMINTFKLITLFGTGDAKSLSSGISEALITTEFGLIVAIPALLMSAFLSRKAAGILGEMEKTSISFMNGLSVIRNPVVETEKAGSASEPRTVRETVTAGS